MITNVVGETMKLHPHGDQSIFAALVNLANKGLLIDRQGNFGNIFTGLVGKLICQLTRFRAIDDKVHRPTMYSYTCYIFRSDLDKDSCRRLVPDFNAP